MQAYHQYHNSSFKTSPAQRDASSQNAAIYEAARRKPDAESKGKNPADGGDRRQEPNAEQSARQRLHIDGRDDNNLVGIDGAAVDLGSTFHYRQGIHSQQGPGFKTDARGSVYRNGSDSGRKWWKRLGCMFRSHTARKEDKEVVR